MCLHVESAYFVTYCPSVLKLNVDDIFYICARTSASPADYDFHIRSVFFNFNWEDKIKEKQN